jgi:hypothetical protein
MTSTSDHVGEIQAWVEGILIPIPCDGAGKIRQKDYWHALAEGIKAQARIGPLTSAQAELLLKCMTHISEEEECCEISLHALQQS